MTNLNLTSAHITITEIRVEKGYNSTLFLQCIVTLFVCKLFLPKEAK